MSDSMLMKKREEKKKGKEKEKGKGKGKKRERRCPVARLVRLFDFSQIGKSTLEILVDADQPSRFPFNGCLRKHSALEPPLFKWSFYE